MAVTLRVASASGRRLSSYRRPLFPSLRVLRQALVGWEAPHCRSWLAAAARGERRRRPSWLSPTAVATTASRSFASAAQPPIKAMADAADRLNGGRWARPALSAPRLLGAFPKRGLAHARQIVARAPSLQTSRLADGLPLALMRNEIGSPPPRLRAPSLSPSARPDRRKCTYTAHTKPRLARLSLM